MFFPSLGPCFYILGDFFTVDGAGRGDFMVLLRRELQCNVPFVPAAWVFLVTSKAQPCSESLRERTWQPPSL